MAGPLKTLFGALQASTFITSNNVTLIFGSEELNQQRVTLPYVVMVPLGGPVTWPGYEYQGDAYVEQRWEFAETIEFWLYNASQTAGAQGAIDHVDAIESLRLWMLSALQDQRAQYTDVNSVAYGLQYKVETGRWEASTNPASRFGRCYVLSVRVQVTVAMAAPQEATITSDSITYTVSHNPP